MHAIHFVPEQFPTIQAAVDAAEHTTTIIVCPHAYDETVVVRDKPYLVIQSARLSRRGVTVTGREGWGVFVIERSTLHLSGIVVRSNGRLRGIWVRDSKLSLQDCVVAGNRTWTQPDSNGFGAGMECRHSAVRIQKSTIVGNTIEQGGGTTTDALGGGIYFQDCNIEIAGSSIQANAVYSGARACGGGIYCERSRMRLWKSRVTDNSLRAGVCEGAGIYFKDPSECQLAGSVITGNGSAEGRGGGVFIEGDAGKVKIHRNTVVRQNHPDDVYIGTDP